MGRVLPVYRTSRSQIEDREDCGRLRLLGWDLDGLGYTLKGTSVPLLGGTSGHEGFAELWRSGSVDAAVNVARGAFLGELEQRGFRYLEASHDVRWTIDEQLWLLEVIIRGWVFQRWRRLQEEYDLFLPPETTFDWQLSHSVVEPVRIDFILQNRETRGLVIVDYKFTSTADNAWFETHELSRQTILYIQALTEKLQEWGLDDVDVEGMMYEGLIRGSWRKDDGQTSPFKDRRIQQTPWCYGYTDDLDWQSSYTSRKGWRKAAAWQYFDGNAEGLIDHLQAEKDNGGNPKLAGMFATMPPAMPPDSVRTSLVRQIAHEEEKWVAGLRRFAEMREALGDDHPQTQAFLDEFAPQRTRRCTKYGYEHRCQFYGKGVGDGICFAENSLQLLAEDAQYEVRVPHHETEPQSEPTFTQK